jgi:hypothetical protein
MSKTSTKRKRARTSGKEMTAEDFIALPNAEKDRIYAELENESPQQRAARSRPLNAAERKQWRAMKKKMGRPKVGEGSQAISLTVEKSLLGRATVFARQNGIKRAELFAKGLRLAMGEAS